MKKRLGILLSGRGSNFEAIADHIDRGELDAEIAVVISNVEQAPGLQKACQRGLETIFLGSKGVPREEYDRRIVVVLKQKSVDLVCLAGFMRLLSPVLVQAFPNRILNIHPALLPAFPGLEAQKQALEYGVRVSGCTVHIVDEGLDSGPIILQAVVPVLDDDTEEALAERILKEEHKLYSKAIGLVLEGQFRIEGRRIIRTHELHMN
ncbi:MAG TPA: phosphoribosylglycinamide formyltransferase [Terriglobia bacterium]|nr:phosphoribosylglycinamide formyltransferase [Terriglobia bacterium]